MDLGFRFWGMLIIFFMVMFAATDFMVNSELKHNTFESIRAANQDSMKRVEEDYDVGEVSEAQILTEWLVDYASKNSLNYKEIELEFVELSTDPPTVIVKIKGELNGGYMKISKRALVEYISGATLITDDDSEEEGEE